MKWISTSRHDLAVHLLTCCEILIEIKSNFVLCLFSFMKHMKMKVVVPVLPSLCQKIWQMVTSITRKKCINLGLCDVLSTDLEGTTLILVTSLPSPWRSVHNKIFLFSILQFACNCCVQQRKYNGYWNMNTFGKVMCVWEELPIHNNSYTTCDCINFL